MSTPIKNLGGFNWLLKSSGIIVAGTFLGQILGYVTTVLATRSLGVEQYGHFVLMISLTVLLTGLVTGAFSRTLARFCARYQAKEEEGYLKGTLLAVSFAALTLSLSISIGLFFFADLVAKHYLHKPDLAIYLKVLLPTIPLLSINGCLLQAARGIGYATDKVLVESVLKPLSRCIAYGVMFSSLSISFLVYAELGLVLLLTGVTLFLGWKRFYSYLSIPSRLDGNSLIKFTLPLFPALMATQLVSQLPLMSLGFIGKINEAGLLAVALKLALLGKTLLMSFNMNFAPMISAYHGAEKMNELKLLFQQVSRLLCFLLSAWVGGVIIFGQDLLFFFGEEFIDGYWILVILSAVTLPVGLTGPVSHLITMTGHTKVTLHNGLINLVLMGLLLLLIVPSFGALGAAATALICSTSFQVYQAWCAYRLTGISGWSTQGIVSAFLIIVGGMFVFFSRKYLFGQTNFSISSIGIGIMFYVGGLIMVFSLLLKTEKNWLMSSLRRKLL